MEKKAEPSITSPKWLCNYFNPKHPRFDRYVLRRYGETQESALASARRWLVGKGVGTPRATETYTVERLLSGNYIGVYDIGNPYGEGRTVYFDDPD